MGTQIGVPRKGLRQAPTETARFTLWGSHGVEVTGFKLLPAAPSRSIPLMRN